MEAIECVTDKEKVIHQVTTWPILDKQWMKLIFPYIVWHQQASLV